MLTLSQDSYYLLNLNIIHRAKLRAVRLQSYWKRICDDEKASKQRNQQLLRDLDRMEANMASLEARREKLKHMKVRMLTLYFFYELLDFMSALLPLLHHFLTWIL